MTGNWSPLRIRATSKHDGNNGWILSWRPPLSFSAANNNGNSGELWEFGNHLGSFSTLGISCQEPEIGHRRRSAIHASWPLPLSCANSA